MANPCSLHAFGVHIHGVQHSQILEIIRAYAFIEIVEQRAERVGKIGIPAGRKLPDQPAQAVGEALRHRQAVQRHDIGCKPAQWRLELLHGVAEPRIQVHTLQVLAHEDEGFQRRIDRRVLHAAPEGEHVVGDVTMLVDIFVEGGAIGRFHDGTHGEFHILQQTGAEFRTQDYGVVEGVDDGTAHGIRILLVV